MILSDLVKMLGLIDQRKEISVIIVLYRKIPDKEYSEYPPYKKKITAFSKKTGRPIEVVKVSPGDLDLKAVSSGSMEIQEVVIRLSEWPVDIEKT